MRGRGPLIGVLVTAVAAVSLTLLFSDLFSGQDANCKNINQNREPLRLILQDSQRQSERRVFSATLTHEDGSKEKIVLSFPQSADSSEFYKRSIDRLRPVNCDG